MAVIELLIATGAAAAPLPKPAYELAFEQCAETAVTDPQIAACYWGAVEAADRVLNARWREMNAKLTEDDFPGAKGKLLAEQRAWITFKESACDFYDGNGFGSMHRVMAKPQCQKEIIEHRTAQLEAIITWISPIEGVEAPTPE